MSQAAPKGAAKRRLATATAVRSTVPPEGDAVVLLPDSAPGWAGLGVLAAPPDQAAELAARGRQSTHLAVLVDRVADPVDARVVPDDLVEGVHQNDLIILVHGVLVDPVRVEHAEPAALAANTLLGDHLQVLRGLQLRDALVHGLAVHDTLHKAV